MRRRYKPIRLDSGGAAWRGWSLSPFGKAKDFRLITPHGETYTAGDLIQLRGLMLDVDFLRGRVHELQGKIEAHACHFAPSDVAVLHAAIAVLGRELPASRSRARRIVTGRTPSVRLISSL